MKTLYESIFDVDDNIEDLDIETLYGCWCAIEEKDFAQRSNRLAGFIQSTCKWCYKVPSQDSEFLSQMELDNNKWYVGLDYDLDGDSGYNPIFFHKSGNRFTRIEVSYKRYGDKGGKVYKIEKPITDSLIYIDKKDMFMISKQMKPILHKSSLILIN